MLSVELFTTDRCLIGFSRSHLTKSIDAFEKVEVVIQAATLKVLLGKMIRQSQS